MKPALRGLAAVFPRPLNGQLRAAFPALSSGKGIAGAGYARHKEARVRQNQPGEFGRVVQR